MAQLNLIAFFCKGKPIFPIVLGGLTVHSLGEVSGKHTMPVNWQWCVVKTQNSLFFNEFKNKQFCLFVFIRLFQTDQDFIQRGIYGQ